MGVNPYSSTQFGGPIRVNKYLSDMSEWLWNERSKTIKNNAFWPQAESDYFLKGKPLRYDSGLLYFKVDFAALGPLRPFGVYALCIYVI